MVSFKELIFTKTGEPRPAKSGGTSQSERFHTVTITEATPRASMSQDGPFVSTVKITVDEFEIQLSSNICDPLTPENYGDCEWYLNDYLRQFPYDERRKRMAEDEIAQYGQNLARQLDWSGYELRYPNIRVDIRQNERVRSRSTIHALHWEHLEAVASWPGIRGQRIRVRVRRVINPPAPFSEPENPVRTYYRQGNQFNILLVIARTLDDEPGRLGRDLYLEDVSPAMGYRSIINAQKRLAEKGSERIRLEVVRPGSFEALAEHLRRRTAEEGLGYFRLVHFDTHGIVKPDTEQAPSKYKAYLRFASERVVDGPTGEKSGDLDWDLTDKPAEDIARLLRDHGISSAVVTACNSGKAKHGSDANLCSIFAEHNISEVLAISFGISTLAVQILCETFYRFLIVEGDPFPEAARKARADLRRRSVRKGMGQNGRGYANRELRDWFIPVTYSRLEEASIFHRATNSSANRPQLRPNPSSLSLRSIGHFADPTPDCLNDKNFLNLDIEVLRLEMTLLKFDTVLLYGSHDDNSLLLKHLEKCWTSTHFLKRVITFSARDFLSRNVHHITSSRKSEVEAYSNLSKKTKKFIKTTDSYRSSLKSVAVVITHLDSLFPKDVEPAHRTGQERLKKFLENIIIEPRKKEGNEYKSPFLILLAKEDLIPKLIDKYSNLGVRAIFRNRKARIDEFDTSYS